MKRQNRIKPETLYNVSEKNSMCMETSQRPAILNQKYKKDEEIQWNDVKKAKEPRIKKEARLYVASIINEIYNTNKNVYDDFRDVKDDNLEVVVAEPVNIQNNESNNCSLVSITSSIEPVSVSIEDSVLKGFSIFGDANRFENIMDCSKKTVEQCIISYIQCKFTSLGKRKKAGERFRSLLIYLKMVEFGNGITLMPSVIGTMFMNKFEDFLLENKLSPNTVAGMIGLLKCVMRWAGTYGARISTDLDNYKVKLADVKPKIVLTEDELQRIYWFDIDSIPVRPQLKRTYMKVRDHFILSCYIGQRYSDTIRVDEKNFDGNFKEKFSIQQLKTDNKAMFDFSELYGKYPPIVKSILVKYGYKAPWNGHLSNYNHYLHQLMEIIGLDDEVKIEYKSKNGEMIPKIFKLYEVISSHCARRTFITNAIERNVNVQKVKRASGHVSDSSFSKYVIDKRVIEKK